MAQASARLPAVVRPGEHACCRFGSAADRWRIAVDVVRDGLHRGHRVLLVSDRDDVEGLVSELAARDDAVEPALQRGQLQVRSAADTYAPDGRFVPERTLSSWREELDRARADRYAGITIVGEPGEALCAAGGAGMIDEYERRLDELDFSAAVLLCQYDHALFDAGTVGSVAGSHDVDLAPELATIGRHGALAAARLRSGALRVAGELDIDSAPVLAEVLGAYFHGPLRLDLADLNFVDVGGMRALRSRTGEPVTITGASPSVRRLLSLLGWDTDPGVHVLEPA